MLVSHKLKLIFVHIPKTAGGSFRQAIRYIDPNPEEIGHYHDRLTIELRKKYKNYSSITIIRNSYEALASRYRFEHIQYKKKGKKLRKTFKQYIASAKLKIMNQYDYIFADNGDKVIDYVLDFNNIEKEIQKLGEVLKIKFPKLRKSCHYYGQYDWKQYYDVEAKKIIEKRCAKDLKYFGWKFGE